MKSTQTALSSTFFFIFLLFSPALAQNLLQKSEIDQYINSVRELNQLRPAQPEINNSKTQLVPRSGDQQNISMTPITDNLEFLRTQPNYEAFKSTIRKYGFSTPENWANVGDKVMMAYSAYHLKNDVTKGAPSVSEILTDMQEQQTNIKNNPYITQEQKLGLLNKIQNSMALLRDPNYINSENISVIGPYIERLDSLFKEYP